MALTIPNTFETGDTALASEVNANFQAVKTEVDLKIGNTLLTTKGDIIVASAASTPARLGVGTDGQFLVANSSATNGVHWSSAVPRGVVSYGKSTSGSTVFNSYGGGTIGLSTGASSFLPVAGRLYRITYSIGQFAQPNSPDLVLFTLYNSVGTTITRSLVFEDTVNTISHSHTVLVTTSQLGTSATTLGLQATVDQSISIAYSNDYPTMIVVEDIGQA